MFCDLVHCSQQLHFFPPFEMQVFGFQRRPNGYSFCGSWLPTANSWAHLEGIVPGNQQVNWTLNILQLLQESWNISYTPLQKNGMAPQFLKFQKTSFFRNFSLKRNYYGILRRLWAGSAARSSSIQECRPSCCSCLCCWSFFKTHRWPGKRWDAESKFQVVSTMGEKPGILKMWKFRICYTKKKVNMELIQKTWVYSLQTCLFRRVWTSEGKLKLPVTFG